MGRRKVEIKRIENKNNRQITFCKRRNGLMEKARQLSVLCGTSVAISIVSATGKLYSFSSGDSMDKLLSDYEIHHANELKTLCLIIVERDQHQGTTFFTTDDARKTLRQGFKLVDLAEKTRSYLYHKDLLTLVQCKLEEAKSDNVTVSVDSLISIEEQLKTALSITRARKTELMMKLVKNLQDKEKLSEQENQVLTSQMGKMKKLLETENERAMLQENDSGYNPPETLPLLK